MLAIKDVIETKEVLEYLQTRGILKQYAKVKGYLLDGHSKMADLKMRKGRWRWALDVWQFRITQKYRAICYFEDDVLRVIHISDHQD